MEHEGVFEMFEFNEQYLLPNGSAIRIFDGYTTFIITSTYSNSSLFKVNNYLIRLYYTKKIKNFFIKYCYPVKVNRSVVSLPLCQKIISFIDSANDVEEEDEEVLQDEILSSILFDPTLTPLINCYKYNSDEMIQNDGVPDQTVKLVNISDTKYIFQSRTQQFTLYRGDLIFLPPSASYKLISPQNVDKYLLEIRS